MRNISTRFVLIILTLAIIGIPLLGSSSASAAPRVTTISDKKTKQDCLQVKGTYQDWRSINVNGTPSVWMGEKNRALGVELAFNSIDISQVSQCLGKNGQPTEVTNLYVALGVQVIIVDHTGTQHTATIQLRDFRIPGTVYPATQQQKANTATYPNGMARFGGTTIAHTSLINTIGIAACAISACFDTGQWLVYQHHPGLGGMVIGALPAVITGLHAVDAKKYGSSGTLVFQRTGWKAGKVTNDLVLHIRLANSLLQQICGTRTRDPRSWLAKPKSDDINNSIESVIVYPYMKVIGTKVNGGNYALSGGEGDTYSTKGISSKPLVETMPDIPPNPTLTKDPTHSPTEDNDLASTITAHQDAIQPLSHLGTQKATPIPNLDTRQFDPEPNNGLENNGPEDTSYYP